RAALTVGLGRSRSASAPPPAPSLAALSLPDALPISGSSAALPEQFSQAGRLVQAFIDQLSPITGKSHTVEFAFGGIGMNGHWGADRKSTRLNSSHVAISYAVFCVKKKISPDDA